LSSAAARSVRSLRKCWRNSGDYTVKVVDRAAEALALLPRHARVSGVVADVADPAALDAVLKGAFAVLSAAPFHLTGKVAEGAARMGCHYLDLTEDVATTRKVKELAKGARTAFIPQCGLAPGFISIAGAEVARGFDRVEELRLRVGALPRYPSNSLGYNLTWSTEGVINEYCEPCEALVDGELKEVEALEGLETFSLDGVTYEAFNTSAVWGSLAEVLAGKAKNLNYKSIRYPGHCALMRTLLNDLDLRSRRGLLKDVLEGAVPGTEQDVVVFFVTASGWRNGRLMQESYAGRVLGEHHGAHFLERHPDHHRRRDLHGAGPAGPGSPAPVGLCAAGGDCAQRLPGQPVRQGLSPARRCGASGEPVRRRVRPRELPNVPDFRDLP